MFFLFPTKISHKIAKLCSNISIVRVTHVLLLPTRTGRKKANCSAPCNVDCNCDSSSGCGCCGCRCGQWTGLHVGQPLDWHLLTTVAQLEPTTFATLVLNYSLWQQQQQQQRHRQSQKAKAKAKAKPSAKPRDIFRFASDNSNNNLSQEKKTGAQLVQSSPTPTGHRPPPTAQWWQDTDLDSHCAVWCQLNWLPVAITPYPWPLPSPSHCGWLSENWKLNCRR